MPTPPEVIPRRDVIDILRFLFDHPDSKVRDYIIDQGFPEKERPYTSIASEYKRLVERGLVKMRREGMIGYYTAVSREAFEDYCMRIVLQHVFEGSPERMQAAAERVGQKTKGRKSK